MPSAYPTAYDNIPANKTDATPAPTDHAGHHNLLADAVNQLQRSAGSKMAKYVIAASNSAFPLLADVQCTGVADDVQINSLLASGAWIALLDGTFNITSPLIGPNTPFTLTGEGKATIIKAGNGQTTPILRVLGPTGIGNYGVHMQRVAHLVLDGSLGAGASAHGMEVSGATYQGLFEHLHVTGCKGHSIYFHSMNTTQGVQTFGTTTGGTFTLTLDGQTTGAIAYNATAAQVASAVAALSNVGVGNVTGTGGPLGTNGARVVLTFTGGSIYSVTMPIMTLASSITGGGGAFVGGGERPAYNRVAWCNIENGSRDGIRSGDIYPAGTYSEHQEFLHNSITFHAGNGVFATGNNNRIHSNQFDYLAIGVYLYGCENNAVWGNTFDRCLTHCGKIEQGGLHTFMMNLWGDNQAGLVANNKYFYLTGGTSGNKFLGNSVLKTGDAAGGTRWDYGFYEDAGVGQSGAGYWGPNIYVGNAFSFTRNSFNGSRPVEIGNTYSDKTIAGFGPAVRNSGTTSIAAAGTNVAVTHGLGLTPDRIILTPTADTQGRRWWVSAKGATTFTITLDAAAVTNPITFDWLAQVGDG